MAQAEPAELFKLLSADTRIAIIELLKHGPLKVNEIAGSLGISPSAVSQHLRLLKSAGLVRGKRDGYW
ncbi:MAG: ArsR/SmtB family transcription factor, partial [Candidatus Bipolaricaulia bacterium]